MVKTRRMGRRSQSERSTRDTKGISIAKFEARHASLEENRPEQQQPNTVELPTTETTRNPDSASGTGTSRKRRTRSCTLIDLSNAARDMARATATSDTDVDIIDITDGWETPIPRRKPKKEEEPAPSMVEFGRETRAEVDYAAAMQRVHILPSARLDKRAMKKLGIYEGVAHCLRGMEMDKFVRKIGKTYEIPTREFLSTSVLKYLSTTSFDATTGVL